MPLHRGFAQSNGLVERTVQTAKKLLKKTYEDNKNPYSGVYFTKYFNSWRWSFFHSVCSWGVAQKHHSYKEYLAKANGLRPQWSSESAEKKKKNGQLRGSILMEGTSPLNHENVEISECVREEPGNQQSCWRNLAKVNQDHILWEQMTIVTGETGKKFWRDKKPRYMKSSSSDWSSWGKQQQRPCCRPTLTWWPRRVWQRTKNSYYTSPIILLLVGSSVFPCVTENDFFVLNDIEHQTFY